MYIKQVGWTVLADHIRYKVMKNNSDQTKNPIIKALILSLAVLLIIEVLSALGDPIHASVYLVDDTGMNLPRFLALGIVIGYLFDKLK